MESLKHKPYFIWLFPILFYLFGLSEYGEYIELKTVFIYSIIFTVIVFVIYYFFTKLLKFNTKILSIVFFIFLVFYSFFSDIKMGLMKSTFGVKISSYPILILLFIIASIIIYFILKRHSKLTNSIYNYCNYLVVILSIMQLFIAIQTVAKPYQSANSTFDFQEIKKTNNPSIYLILLDGYAGNRSLNKYFKYDNSKFTNQLKAKSFFISDTINSNYHITIASVNSILNMQYPNKDALAPWNNYSLFLKSFKSIEKNQLIKFFETNEYEINNLSLFDFDAKKTTYSAPRFKKGIGLLQAKFFHNKLIKDMVWMLCVGKYKQEYFFQNYTLHLHNQNNKLIEHTIEISKAKKTNPHFTYTHLLMPHQPYFTDSMGIIQDVITQEENKCDPALFVSYLKYANKKIVALTDSIVQNNPKSIIILMSDHGYRDYPDSLSHLMYNNFLAVRFPDSNYSQIAKVKSNVNVFRTILNQYFNQQLPMLKDSFFFIDEEKNKFLKLSK